MFQSPLAQRASRSSRLLACLALLASLLFGAPVFAQMGDDTSIDQLQITFDPATIRPTPVAVPDTFNIGSVDPDGMQARIAQTIRRGLEVIGLFEVYGPDRYFFDANAEGMTLSTINFDNWLNVGAHALVKTSMQVASAQVALDFRLYDVTTGAQIPIDWEAKTVPISQADDEVYAFLNALVLYFTDSPGLFGTRIAYVARDSAGHKQVYTTGFDGSSTQQMTDDATLHLLPSWGPGGSLFYTSYRHGNPDLFLGDERFSHREGLNTNAAMRPGSNEVAVTLTRDGQAEIYILDATSGDILRRCTNHAAEDLSPSWSPDGSRLTFVSDRSGGPQIFVMNADCSNPTRVTFRGRYNTEPDWSPSGDLIVFTGRDSRNRFDIFTVDPANGDIVRLTQDQGNNQAPSWSPDGRYIVFASTRSGGNSRLYVMTADGQRQALLTTTGSGYETPVWRR